MRRTAVMLVWSVVLAGAVVVSVAAAVGQLPVAEYPPPVKARAGGALAACPNPAGLERFSSTTAKTAVRIAGAYERVSVANDLRNSDPAWWPQVRDAWRSGKPPKEALKRVVYGAGEPLARNGYSVIVRFSCGGALVAKSLIVGIGPRQTHPPYCSACISRLFFVDRRGRALIYFLY